MPHSIASAFQPRLRAALIAAAAAIALAALLRVAPAELPLPSQSGAEVAAERAYGALPLSFERNVGQQDPRVDYLARTDAGTFFLTGWGARLIAGEQGSTPLDLRLLGASPAEPRALERLPGEVNYLVGEDPSAWHRGVPTFEAVRYPGAYPGIDLDWHGDSRRLEYDFRVAPGADPDRIALRIAGAESLTIAPNGDLVISAGGRTLRQRAPIAYQVIGGERRRIPSSYLLDANTVTFRLGAYDRSRPLVIDPVLAYSTYLGGDGSDNALAIAVDSSGAAYVAGDTDSTDFNTMGPIEGDGTGTDAFVSKLNPAGSALAYSTYLGGDGGDHANAIAVDASGAAYVAGYTDSTDFNTVGPIEGDGTAADAFVSKLTVAGSALAYSTYLGGNGFDNADAIAVDSSGAAYVGGYTDSTDFNTVGPIEGDSGDGAFSDVFISKLTAAGSALAYSTYLGGNSADVAFAIAVDSSGAAYVAGETDSTDFNTVGAIEGNGTGADAFISKLNAAGSALGYSTYLGGNNTDLASAIAVDSSGAAYVAGWTESTDFDTVGQIEGDGTGRDAFVSKLNAAGSALGYSTYLGGGGDDVARGIAVDTSGAAYVAGQTESTDFNTVGPIESNEASDDAFISKLTAAGSALAYSTYLGGDGIDAAHAIAVDSSGAAYVAGVTESTDFNPVGPIEGDGTGDDAFVSKLGGNTGPPGPAGPIGPTGSAGPAGPAGAAGAPASSNTVVVVKRGRGVADAVCPANRPHALGGGFTTSRGSLNPLISAPLSGGKLAATGAQATGWRVKASNTTRVAAFAICGP